MNLLNYKKQTFIVFISSLLAGCLSISNIQPNSSLELGPDEGIIIIGASQNARLGFFAGYIQDNKFFDDQFAPKGLVGNAESGYLIRKLKATGKDRGYGLASVNMSRSHWAQCDEEQEMVLTVKPGEIQYYIDMDLSEDNSGLRVSYKDDIDAAQQYIKKAFPNNTIPVTRGSFSQIIKGTCYPTLTEIYNHLYLPGTYVPKGY
jgi:hypothetical protein